MAFNLGQGVQMFARATTTRPSFTFAYTNWSRDEDVSLHMHRDGSIENGIAQVGWVAACEDA